MENLCHVLFNVKQKSLTDCSGRLVGDVATLLHETVLGPIALLLTASSITNECQSFLDSEHLRFQ